MNTSEMETIIHRVQMRITLHFEFVLFPIDFVELIRTLSNKGFEIIAPPPPVALPGARLGFKGDLAKKGKCIIDINPDRQILGVKGVDFGEIDVVYKELKEIIQNDLDINIEKRIRFYELTGEYEIESNKRAIDSIANLFAQNDFVSKCTSILDNEVTIFTIRLVSKGQIPNQEEWFDISIEPIVLKPSLFLLSAVFRSKNESKVLTFARTSESKILELIRLIQD